MKVSPVAEVIGLIPNAASLMIGGFMGGGSPHFLIDELMRQRKGWCQERWCLAWVVPWIW